MTAEPITMPRLAVGPVLYYWPAAQLQAFYNTYRIQNLSLYRGDQDAVFEALAVYGLPTTLLIDDRGQEVARLTGPTAWDAADVIESIKAIRNQR
jgi:hypothetical protein